MSTPITIKREPARARLLSRMAGPFTSGGAPCNMRWAFAIQSGWEAHNAGIAVFTSTSATKYPRPAEPDGSRTASVTGENDRACVVLTCRVVMSRSLIELHVGRFGIG